MRRIVSLLILMLTLGGLSYLPSYADCSATFDGSAATYLQDCANNANNGDGTKGVGISYLGNGVDGTRGLVKMVAERAIQFGALFAIGAIVFAGIRYTTSYGDDEKVKKAKMTGIYGIIGLVLLLVAFPLVDIIVNFVYSLGQ